MGSVSSLIPGGNFHDKHCRVFESRSRKPSHLQKFVRQQDGLLKFSGGHEPFGNRSRCEKAEDFFYISISQGNRLATTGKRKNRASSLSPPKDVMDIKGPPPVLVPFSGQLEKGSEMSVVRPTAFKAVVPRNGTNLNGPLGSQMSVKLTFQGNALKPGNHSENQQGPDQQHTSCSGTLSDSGRNSMSSLPTHSTGCSHGTEHTGAPTSLRKKFGGSVQHVGGILRNISNTSASDGGHCPASQDSSSCIHPLCSVGQPEVPGCEEKSAGKRGESQGLQQALCKGKAGSSPTCSENPKHCVQGTGSPEWRHGADSVRASDQQFLQLQVSQLQQEKQQLKGNFAQLLQECNSLKAKCKTYEREQNELGPKLEEIKWEVCQKSGVISLLKQQLKDSQTELTHKTNEVLTFRNQLREAKGKLSSREQQVEELENSVQTKARELEVCENELQRMKNAADLLREKVSLLQCRILDSKQNSSSWRGQDCGDENDISPNCSQLEPASAPQRTQQTSSTLQGQVNKLKAQLEQEKQKNQALMLDFQKERLLWCAEKERVIQYQKQLQQNYLHVHRQNHSLERTVRQLSVQLGPRASVERVGQVVDTFEEIAATAI
ncbi:leucine zipper putative tumor suppressor 1-like [Hypanus sabinus]|uniref:leucine zipper putative tumor suppressor 1-like n=1 Tax=Hypanus sabinus TaxID=79690 RepID=UPI0028C49FAF|nr:leucine zipper putative tumor suppressor 1-like [Hypanus sabinus]XP_059821951.1 leucine zipper putative tumor suppressor 1-like [Hypanus sabinus]XP_059821957.1 leucine zipper putative tumor suppressor 1-like [Hypanus sabinus]XP_059821962.1 leucine zipper putative tumor suppressor 1-like [Hypanus sabinus]XP_059821968.1 leucine zipper putative tumor suppressor 1-like [Hypanus sabinus]XP_059821974.1 leucine zipper putative tumor suppressor 1-like [Hypanus sabinus]XP_059821981.1 leucine zipper